MRRLGEEVMRRLGDEEFISLEVTNQQINFHIVKSEGGPTD